MILENERIERLAVAGILCEVWFIHDAAHKVVRFATSWATTPDHIRALAAAL